MRLLATREHTRAELVRKLGSRFPAALLESVLEGLAERNLQSDVRYAEQYVAMRIRKGYGPVRIRNELRERGVNATLIATTLEEAGADWFELMREAHDRKYGRGLPSDRKEQARRARFLEYRGFSSDQIRGLLLNQ